MHSNLLKLEKSRFPNGFMIATNKPVEIKLKKLAEHFPINVLFVKDFLKLTKDKIILTSHITS